MGLLFKPVYRQPEKTGDETLDLAAEVKAQRVYQQQMVVYEQEVARRDELQKQGIYVKSIRRD